VDIYPPTYPILLSQLRGGVREPQSLTQQSPTSGFWDQNFSQLVVQKSQFCCKYGGVEEFNIFCVGIFHASGWSDLHARH